MLFTTHDLLSNTCACAHAGHQQSTCTCQATCGAMLRKTNTFAMLGTPSKVFGSPNFSENGGTMLAFSYTFSGSPSTQPCVYVYMCMLWCPGVPEVPQVTKVHLGSLSKGSPSDNWCACSIAKVLYFHSKTVGFPYNGTTCGLACACALLVPCMCTCTCIRKQVLRLRDCRV